MPLQAEPPLHFSHSSLRAGIGSYNVIGWSDGAISATILASQRLQI